MLELPPATRMPSPPTIHGWLSEFDDLITALEFLFDACFSYAVMYFCLVGCCKHLDSDATNPEWPVIGLFLGQFYYVIRFLVSNWPVLKMPQLPTLPALPALPALPSLPDSHLLPEFSFFDAALLALYVLFPVPIIIVCLHAYYVWREEDHLQVVGESSREQRDAALRAQAIVLE